jgi:hypothetical protein
MNGHKEMMVAIKNFWYLVASLIVVYWISVLLFPMKFNSFIADGILAALSFAVMYVFIPGVYRLLSQPVDGRILIRLGVIGAWLCTGLLCIHRIVIQELGLGGGPLTHPFRGFITVLFMVFAMLHITAIGAIDNHTLRYNICVMLWAILSGLLMSSLVFTLRHV